GPPAVRGDRRRPAGAAGPAAPDAGRLRAAVPAVLLLPHARQGDQRRGRVGRARRPLRAGGRTGPGGRARGRAAGAAAAAWAGGWGRSIRFAVFRWRVDAGAAGPAAGPAPRRAGGRPGPDRGGL